jgi:hypothetical protein
MADQGSAAYREGYRLGLRDALTGGMTTICDGGPRARQEFAGYLAGLARGRALARQRLEREAERELEAGL